MQRKYRRPPQQVQKISVVSRIKEALRDLAADCAKLLSELTFVLPILFLIFCRERLTGISMPEWNIYLSANQYLYMAYVVALLWIVLPAGRVVKGHLFYAILVNLLPIEIVLFPMYFSRAPKRAALVLGAGVLGSLISVLFIWKRKAKYRGRNGAVWDRAKRSMGRAALVWMSVLLLVPAISALRGITILKPAQTHEERADQSAWIVSNRFFEEDVWRRMQVQDRLNVLQAVVDCETLYMGIAPLEVCAQDLSDAQNAITTGWYVLGSGMIRIDIDELAYFEAEKCLTTVLHECRHAYQRNVVELFDFKSDTVQTHLFFAQARQWKQEFEANVVSDPYLAFDAYYGQSTEQDARAYAEARKTIYLPAGDDVE